MAKNSISSCKRKSLVIFVLYFCSKLMHDKNTSLYLCCFVKSLPILLKRGQKKGMNCFKVCYKI